MRHHMTIIHLNVLNGFVCTPRRKTNDTHENKNDVPHRAYCTVVTCVQTHHKTKIAPLPALSALQALQKTLALRT